MLSVITLRRASIALLALFWFAAGIAHFRYTEDFALIVPPQVLGLMSAVLIVQLTGALEFAFALGFLIPRARSATGLAACAYCLVVVWANIYQALEGIQSFGMQAEPWQLWLRVLLQIPLIAWIYWASRPARC